MREERADGDKRVNVRVETSGRNTRGPRRTRRARGVRERERGRYGMGVGFRKFGRWHARRTL